MMKDRLLTILLTAIAVFALQTILGLTVTPAAADTEVAQRLDRIETLLAASRTAGGDADVVRAIETLGRDYLRDMETSLDAMEGSLKALEKELASWPGIRDNLQKIETRLAEILAEVKSR
jgi:hypothetical protein